MKEEESSQWYQAEEERELIPILIPEVVVAVSNIDFRNSDDVWKLDRLVRRDLPRIPCFLGIDDDYSYMLCTGAVQCCVDGEVSKDVEMKECIMKVRSAAKMPLLCVLNLGALK